MPACPLCRSSRSKEKEKILFSEIWFHLKMEWGANFTEETISRHSPTESVSLHECLDCKLMYFFPAIGGDAEFYRELTSSCPEYYSEDKWEFEFAKGYLTPNDHLLDVACGNAAFLKNVCGIVKSATGIDTNPNAFLNSAAEEYSVKCCSLAEFSQDHQGVFDIVTAFQIVEHLDDVIPFVETAFTCVKPGGVLIISVPNRRRCPESGFGSLDFPPHHLSRWSEPQLSFLANMLEANLISIGKEPLFLYNSRQNVERKLSLRSRLVVPSFVPKGILKAICKIIRRPPIITIVRHFDLADRLGIYGHNLVAVIRKK